MKKIFSLILSAVVLSAFFPMMTSAAEASLSLNVTSGTVYAGRSGTLKASVTGLESYTLLWSVSDKSVLTVEKGGRITGIKPGTVTVSVSVKGTDLKASCRVTVKNAADALPSAQAKTPVTAAEFVKRLKTGWNLGNTLDAQGDWISGLDTETAWGNPKTTKEMIDAVKKAGFNTVRVPVSWGTNHMDSSNRIDAAWMARVKEVVDYGINNGMYVILNSHHEGGWLIPDEKNKESSEKRLKDLWKQISETFKNYDEYLIFEGMNEPRVEGSPREWSGGTPEEHEILNGLNQAFVDTVRASGGNNKTRYLMVTPYAASGEYSAMSALKIPDDKYIIVSIHSYSPYNMALNTNSKVSALDESGIREIDRLMGNIQRAFLDKGVPVIIGEFGYINKDNETARAEAVRYYLGEAEKKGIPCIWWDNGSVEIKPGSEGFGILDRKTLKWQYPEILKALTE